MVWLRRRRVDAVSISQNSGERDVPVRFIPWLYDLFMATAERTRLAHWRRAVVAPSRGRVLEIGAGTGLNFPYYASATNVVATDVDFAMLKRARRRARESSAAIQLVVADAEALPFARACFDGGVVGLALCTISNPGRALAEMRRVLRPSVAVRLLEHVRVDHPVIGRLQDWLTPVWRLVAGGCRLNRCTTNTIATAGFEMERVESHAGGLALEIVAMTPVSSGRAT